jgi:hypothetical protein
MKLRRLDFAATEPLRKDIAMAQPKRVHSIWAANLKSKKAKGDIQPLYFPDGHEKAGHFKGMAQILVERGYANAPHLPVECREFKCPGGRTDCCCRRLMYPQPDFVNMASNLEIACRARGFDVIFLPDNV